MTSSAATASQRAQQQPATPETYDQHPTQPDTLISGLVALGRLGHDLIEQHPAIGCVGDLDDQRHGPYIQWSRTVKGRTINKMLTPEQLETYQPWIDNSRRLRQLAHELETLSIDALHAAEGWNR